jgi:hypothetical protein
MELGNPSSHGPYVRSLAVLTCECSETCIVAMHVFSQGDLIGIAQFDLDQHQNISSPQTECNSLLSPCPYIKQVMPYFPFPYDMLISTPAIPRTTRLL